MRARILRIPNEKFYNALVDDVEKNLKIIHDIKSFSGVTEFYRSHNYIDNCETIKNSYWNIDVNRKKIYNWKIKIKKINE